MYWHTINALILERAPPPEDVGHQYVALMRMPTSTGTLYRRLCHQAKLAHLHRPREEVEARVQRALACTPPPGGPAWRCTTTARWATRASGC